MGRKVELNTFAYHNGQRRDQCLREACEKFGEGAMTLGPFSALGKEGRAEHRYMLYLTSCDQSLRKSCEKFGECVTTLGLFSALGKKRWSYTVTYYT